MSPRVDGDRKTRVLFVGEAVTLSHAARPLVLSRTLDEARFEPWLATDPRYLPLLSEVPRFRPIRSMDSRLFVERLASGSPLFDAPWLRRCVEQDLQLLDELEPDVVVGDFRVSLSISARVAGLPYLALADSYWSPYARRPFPLPDLAVRRVLGPSLGQRLFDAVRPLAFRQHARPIDRVRRAYGLPAMGSDLCCAYTDADFVLYPDAPGLMPMRSLPSTHQHIGPVLFAPQTELPPWWNELPGDRPTVYVSLGTSGVDSALHASLHALRGLDVNVIVATADRASAHTLPDHVYAAPFLPGDLAAARSELVICNGGATATQQALLQGTPVLGIAGNMDQLMNMAALEHTGAARLVHSGDASAGALRQAIATVLEQPRFAHAARSLRDTLQSHDPRQLFPAALERAVPPVAAPRRPVPAERVLPAAGSRAQAARIRRAQPAPEA